ncbi:1a protein [Olive latent virus 2]|uniref:Replication protein 1a n=1 Tax=Olive latent virus 2 (isolate Italy) TaxID=650489 RepID=1A_OLV2I|nr:1a protein [Olive latent virus 2]Q83943.1 RecName: Full=Replication protein 1a; Includes: RecName: Full=ATP-dependent helicase; Includes: RecName: Full=Methyltransferase [Olive latent virus 2 isolate Italy]CAA64072.1 1a protein [Olive latent virus 2]
MDSAALEKMTGAKFPAVQGVIEEFSRDRVQNVLGDMRSRQVIKYAVGLSEASVQELRFNWPCFTWEEESVPLPPHPFAAYSRRAFTRWAIAQCGPVPIKDFGGNWFLHWQWQTGVHSCCPLLNPRDGAHQTRRELNMESYLRTHGPKYDKFNELSRPDLCHHRAEDCSVRAKAALSVDSAYDMGLKNTCKAMHRAGIELLHGNILFDPDMLIEAKMEGFVAGMNYHWKKTRRSTGLMSSFLEMGSSLFGVSNSSKEGEGHHDLKIKMGSSSTHMVPADWEISYHFRDDCVLGYTHNLADVLSIATGSYVKVGNTFYELERTGLKSGMLMYTITACKGLYDRASARSTPLSAKASTVIINGMSYQVGEKLDPISFPYLAASFYMQAQKAVFEVQQVVDLHTPNRNLWSWFKKKFELKAHAFLFALGLRDSHDEWLLDQIEFELNETVCTLPGEFLEPVSEVERLDAALEDWRRDRERLNGKSVENLKTLTVLVELAKKLGISAYEVLNSHQNESERPKDQWHVEAALFEAVELERAHWKMLTAEAQAMSLQDPLSREAKSKGWSYESSDSLPCAYAYVFSEGRFVKPADLKKKTRVLVSPSMQIMNQIRMAESLEKAIAMNVKSCKKTWIDGVAGCGKTYEIVHTADIFKKDDLILTANKKSQEDIFSQLKPGTDCAKRIRTVDSYLLKPDVQAKRLFIDEAGLVHPGKLLAAMRFAECDDCLLFGDSEQIPFVNIVESLQPAKFLKLEVDAREVRETTYRCPADVTATLATLYKKKKIVTKSKVLKSVTSKSLASASAVSGLDPHSWHLTMYQADKAELVRVARTNQMDDVWIKEHIKTVHEAQGISVPHVKLYRFKTFDQPLFDAAHAEAYRLVAISRHTQSFTYIGVNQHLCKADRMLKFVICQIP